MNLNNPGGQSTPEATGKSSLAPTFALQLILFAAALYSGWTASVISYILAAFVSALICNELLKKPSPIAFAGTVAGFVAAGFIDFSPFVCIMPLMFILPSLSMYLMIIKKKGRIATVAVSSAGYIAVAILSLLVLVILNKGSLSADAIRASVNDAIAYISELTKKAYETALQSSAAIDETALKLLLNQLVSVTPGYIIAGCFCCSYIQSFIARSIMKRNGILGLVYRGGWQPRVSVVTAAVFIICYFVSAFSGKLAMTPFFITVSNLSVILEAVFAIVGFSAILVSIGRRTGRNGTVGAVIIISLIFFSDITLMLLMVCGLIRTIKDFVRTLKKN